MKNPVALLLILFFFSVNLASGEEVAAIEPKADLAKCGELQQFIDSLSGIKAEQSGEGEHEKQEHKDRELSVRKNLLGATIDCAMTEVGNALERVESIALVDDKVENLKTGYASSLGDAIEYYKNKLEKVDGLSIEGTKRFAREISLVRSQRHDPLLRNTANFILWESSQQLFVKARSRIWLVRHSILSLSLARNEPVQNSFNKSMTLLLNAEEENGRARQALERSVHPDQSLATIRDSLGKLLETYQSFFGIGEAVSKSRR